MARKNKDLEGFQPVLFAPDKVGFCRTKELIQSLWDYLRTNYPDLHSSYPVDLGNNDAEFFVEFDDQHAVVLAFEEWKKVKQKNEQ